MDETLEFPDLLRLIDERSTAFRAAIAAAASLDVTVPTCPEWTLFDLAQHLGVGRRSWAATIAAGPDAAGRSVVQSTAPREREALVAWLAESTQELVDALRDAGPDQGCWTWWDRSQSPRTSGAVARHQLQEIAVHTYDAQLTVGSPEPLPEAVALDGVEEFQFTCVATTQAWPHKAAVIEYHATEGRSWRLQLSADGVQVVRLPASPDDDVVADVSARATASELVLFCYDRTSLDSMLDAGKVDGDRQVFDQLIAWDPDA